MKKILVVDDDPYIRNSLKYFLEGKGYQVDIAKDGSEALSLYVKNKYSAIILDVVLPNIDGKRFIDIIKKDDDVKIIVITGYPYLGKIIKVLNEKDIFCIIEKPIDEELLLEKIESQ
jgi:DNA-binding response OmpR family regulator